MRGGTDGRTYIMPSSSTSLVSVDYEHFDVDPSTSTVVLGKPYDENYMFSRGGKIVDPLQL